MGFLLFMAGVMALGGYGGGGGTPIRGQRVVPNMHGRPILKLAGKKVEPHKTFEDFFEPHWLHSDGCQTFYWGFCVGDFIEAYTRYAEQHGWKHQDALNRATRIVELFLTALSPAGAVVGKWIQDNVCLRFDFRIRAYTTDASMGNERLWSISGVLNGWQFEQWMKDPHPLDYLEDSPDPDARGWKRVWMRRDYKPSSASAPGLYEVLWPDSRAQEGRLVLQYLANTAGIRRALLVADWGLGGVSDLVDSGCGETKWMLVGRDNAMQYFT